MVCKDGKMKRDVVRLHNLKEGEGRQTKSQEEIYFIVFTHKVEEVVECNINFTHLDKLQKSQSQSGIKLKEPSEI